MGGIYLYCSKKERRLNAIVCEKNGCKHLRGGEEIFCRFSSKKEKMIRRRKEEK